jgi:hypothetical protein
MIIGGKSSRGLSGLKSSFRYLGVAFILTILSIAPLTAFYFKPAAAAVTSPVYRYTKTFNVVSGSVRGSSVTTDKSGNVYLTGSFTGRIIFDGVGGSDNVLCTDSETGCPFLTKYNADSSYGWTKTFRSTSGGVQSNGVTTDANGNIYMTGFFSGTVLFDGIGGSNSQTSSHSSTFVAKYNANGSYGWAKIFDTTEGSANGVSVTTDANGNIYVTSNFDNTVVFDGVGGSDSQTSNGNTVSLTKYNANGSYGWTKIFGNIGYSNINSTSVAADIHGGIYVTGKFLGTFVFDGLDGSDSQTNSSHNTAFVTKYNANGSYGWTRAFDTTSSDGNASGDDVAVDLNGNVYTTGTFSGTVIFDGVGGSDSQATFNTSVYVTKHNANGSYGWTRIFDTTDGSASGAGIATDSSGNVYVTGYFSGTVIFDGVGGSDSQTDQSSTSDDFFMTKYNANGSYGWTDIFDNTDGYASATDITIDANGYIYTTGRFAGTVAFNGVGGKDTRTININRGNIFLTSYRATSLGSSSDSTQPAYRYTKTFDTTDGSAGGTGVTTDSNGNIYVVGYFSGTIVFDGVGGTDSKTDLGGIGSSFVTKYNTNGSYGWTKIFDTTSGGASGMSVATDTGGNIYITGSYMSTVIFDGVGGTDSQTDQGSGGVFVTKYNANGSYVWTKTFDTSDGSASGAGIATDLSGNVYVTGYFSGTVIFDGVDGGDSQTDSGGGGNSFITKYNANGSYGYTKTFDTTSGGISSMGVTTDIHGNVYVTGYFSGTVIFDGVGGDDSQVSVGSGSSNAFMTKYNANGSYGYTKTFDNTSGSVSSASVITDPSGNIYIVGYFSGTVIFDGVGGDDSQVSVGSGSSNAFMTKYNANGSYGWTKTFNNLGGYAYNTGVTTDPSGNIYMTGSFSGDIVFDGAVGGDGQSSDSINDDSYMTKYNANGSYGWTKAFNNTDGYVYSAGITSDAGGNIYMTGNFSGDIIFDSINGTNHQTDRGASGNSFLTSYQTVFPSSPEPPINIPVVTTRHKTTTRHYVASSSTGSDTTPVDSGSIQTTTPPVTTSDNTPKHQTSTLATSGDNSAVWWYIGGIGAFSAGSFFLWWLIKFIRRSRA